MDSASVAQHCPFVVLATPQSQWIVALTSPSHFPFGIRSDAPPNSARIKAKRVGPKMVNPMVFLCSVLCFFSHFQSAVPSTWSEWRASGGGAVVSGVKLTHRGRIAIEGRAETDQSLITTLEMKGHPLVVNQSTP